MAQQSMRFFLLWMVLLILPANASANIFKLEVVDQNGHPVHQAVVMIEAAEGALQSRQIKWDNEVAQENKQFVPHIIVVPVGTEVLFPNRDRIRHHVYSFSKGNKFELKLYGREDDRSVTFRKTGIVAIGCNIHDDMMGFIRVVDTPYAVTTNKDGEAIFDIPEGGTVKVKAWHPEGYEMLDHSAVFDLSAGHGRISLEMPAKRTQHKH